MDRIHVRFVAFRQKPRKGRAKQQRQQQKDQSATNSKWTEPEQSARDARCLATSFAERGCAHAIACVICAATRKRKHPRAKTLVSAEKSLSAILKRTHVWTVWLNNGIFFCESAAARMPCLSRCRETTSHGRLVRSSCTMSSYLGSCSYAKVCTQFAEVRTQFAEVRRAVKTRTPQKQMIPRSQLQRKLLNYDATYAWHVCFFAKTNTHSLATRVIMFWANQRRRIGGNAVVRADSSCRARHFLSSIVLMNSVAAANCIHQYASSPDSASLRKLSTYWTVDKRWGGFACVKKSLAVRGWGCKGMTDATADILSGTYNTVHTSLAGVHDISDHAPHQHLDQGCRTCLLSRAAWIVHYRWRGAKINSFYLKILFFTFGRELRTENYIQERVISLHLLSTCLFVREFRFDATLCSNLGGENFDAGHIKWPQGPQVPHPWFRQISMCP